RLRWISVTTSTVGASLALGLVIGIDLPPHCLRGVRSKWGLLQGFGLSQVFPIIVAALSTEKDGVLLIENPEVHLHPAGQALMGSFLAEVANSGIQVIIESHSDHVLNGIRRSVKAQQLPHEQVALHFFRPRVDDATQVESPKIDSIGNIDVWPDGFFDQFDKDMNHFAGWGD
ncbi:MAG: DUF3696 domain-containing protein, partial [Desulfomicrobium sp.]